MTRKFNVAVVGATGAVGQQMRKVLAERRFPIDTISLLASKRSAGEKVDFDGNMVAVEMLTEESFKDVDIALFSAGGSVSEKFAPIAAKAGAVVVDNTSAFRMDPEVPLVVPEVNPNAIAGYTKKGIIANPNCSTIQMVVALKPLHDEAKIKRVVVSTYQSVSGAGRSATKELADQSVSIFNGKPFETERFPHRIAFNCLPHIDVFLDNLFTKEEMKMVRETQKIMEDDSIKVSATCVRVPVFSCHSESVWVEFENPLGPDRAREIFSQAPGIVLMDEPGQNIYPTTVDAVDKDDTFVGRIRADDTVDNGLVFWCVSDNLRKGAASNAVQIAELLAEKYL
jgi:aspartate-semialdehyde dehydrogenase